MKILGCERPFFPPLSVGESHGPSGPPEENPHNKISYGNPTKSAANHAFDPSAATCWSKSEWAAQGYGEAVGNPSVMKSPVGGLYSPPDVQSLWSVE